MKIKSKSFSKIEPVIEMPYLLELQKKSFDYLIEKGAGGKNTRGLTSIFQEVFPVENADGSLSIEYVSHKMTEPKFSPQECKDRDVSYAAPIYVTFRLSGLREDGKKTEKSEQEVYLGELPLMTENGSFIINGDERIIVSQIHRSPGVVFEEDEEQKQTIYGKPLFVGRIIPYRGAWIELEFDQNSILYARLEKKKKVLITTLLRALGYEKNSVLLGLFENPEELKLDEHIDDVFIGKFLARDIFDKSTGEILVDVSGIIEQGSGFDKLEIKKEDIEFFRAKKVRSVFVHKNPAMLLTLRKDGIKDQKSAQNHIFKVMKSQEYLVASHVENYLKELIFSDKPKKYDLTEVGRYKINKKFVDVFDKLKKKGDDLGVEFKQPSESRRTLTREDVVAAVYYLINLTEQIQDYKIDDIDHLGNRRVRPVGELLENQIRLGLINMARIIRENLNTKDKATMVPRSVVNTAPFTNNIRKFFGTGQLSQFLEQTNPLAELTNKRRLSALGPGGLNRKRAGFEVRDVHHTHYGRICPIETPEGENIGLIVSLAIYARVNDYGLLETPYRKVEKSKVTDTVKYLTAAAEDEFYVAQATEPADKNGKLTNHQIITRRFDDYPEVSPDKIDYVDISPLQVVSASAAMIPFLEHDDANRALMGSNMQRQAVPLLLPEPALVSTGIDAKIAVDSGVMIIAKNAGDVMWVDSEKIMVFTDNKTVDTYTLKKYNRSNQDTCINQTPIVSIGDKIKKGQPLADGMATSDGQLALGRNLMTAFMPWDGFNFEDAIVISEKVVRDDVFTSVHVQEFTCEARETKGEPEEITRDVPGAGSEDLQQLDEDGIIRIGAEVSKDDILVGKTTPKAEQQVGPEERLIKALFGKKSETTQDASLRVPPGVEGKVIGTRFFVRREIISDKEKTRNKEALDAEYKANKLFIANAQKEYLSKAPKSEAKKIEKLFDELEEQLEAKYKREKEHLKKGDDHLPVAVNKVVKVYIAVKRRLQVGDKLAGRHGNKGVIAKIVPVEDMPRLPDGTPVDVIFSPLSIPSRMNVGQLLEAMLGWAGKMSGTQMVTPVFSGATEEEVIKEISNVRKELIKKGIPEKYLPDENLRVALIDGRTGEPFVEKTTIGYMYVMKLIHLVEDKIHARSTGPYSLVTRQPLGGRAHKGGQRLGEMEVWALEAYGAAHVLQEMLTVKSDDEEGRSNMLKSILEGKAPVKPGVPESFKVLLSEIKALGLNVELSNKKEPKNK